MGRALEFEIDPTEAKPLHAAIDRSIRAVVLVHTARLWRLGCRASLHHDILGRVSGIEVRHHNTGRGRGEASFTSTDDGCARPNGLATHVDAQPINVRSGRVAGFGTCKRGLRRKSRSRKARFGFWGERSNRSNASASYGIRHGGGGKEREANQQRQRCCLVRGKAGKHPMVESMPWMEWNTSHQSIDKLTSLINCFTGR